MKQKRDGWYKKDNISMHVSELDHSNDHRHQFQ